MYIYPKLPEASNLVQLKCTDVMLGMYVSELDCPWSKTPFPLGGFHVRNVDDLQLLQKICKVVTIDTERGARPAKQRAADLTILSSARRHAPEAAAIKVKRDTYPVSEPMKKLVSPGIKAYDALQEAFHDITRAVREGQRLGLKKIEPLQKKLIDSLLINPQALISIST